MPSEQVNLVTQREWRELGFYYCRDDEAREWRIEGSHDGLLKFAECFIAYSADARNVTISEHEHYGPYSYLEIGTWHTPQITDHWIAGTQAQLSELGSRIRKLVEDAGPGTEVLLRDSFAAGSPYELRLIVKDAGFDPAQADPECWIASQ